MPQQAAIRRRTWLAATLGAGLAGASRAELQDRPLRLIVHLPAGSPSDAQARPLAQLLNTELGRPVLVDNRPGAGGVLGVDACAKAPADGHTLVLATIAPLTILPHLMTLPYDPLKDLMPITRVSAGPLVLLAHARAPFDDVPQMIAYARAHPGELQVGGYGIGSAAHLATLMIARGTGADLTHVPYSGGPQQVTDAVAGRIPLLLDFPATTLQHVQSGRLKVLAATGPRRGAALPEAPTFVELGHPDVVLTAWQGVLAPAATPAAVLRRLHQALVKVLAAPELRRLFLSHGIEAVGDTPEAFAAFVRDEHARWGALIREKGVRLP